jgi:HEAT repeat protein
LLSGLLVLVVLTPVLPAATEPDPTYEGKRLSDWLKLLKSKDEKERRNARHALTSFVKQGRTAVEPLVEALLKVSVWDGKLLDARVRLLVELGPAVVPALTAALWNGDLSQRALAVVALGRLGSAARPAVPSLLERLHYEDVLLRVHVIRALGGIQDPSAIASLAERLQDRKQEVREAAATALVDLAAPANVLLPTLLLWLKAGPASQRRLAAYLLGSLGPEGSSAAAALAKALDDEDGAVRQEALAALAAMGRGGKSAVDSLRSHLKNKERAEDHLATAEALWMVVRHSDALIWLKARVKGEPGAEQIEAARLLWRYTRAPEAISSLAKAIEQGNPAALSVLREIGPGAKAALPAILPLLTDTENRKVRLDAVAVVARLGVHGKPAVAALEKMLDSKDAWERSWVAWALWQVQNDRRSVPLLVKILQDRISEDRVEAAILLRRMGLPAKEGVEALRAALKDDNARVRLQAATTLWKVEQHRDALPTLVRLLTDSDSAIRQDASIDLGAEFGEKAVPAVPVLVKVLWQDSNVAMAAAEALGRVGPTARQAVGALSALLRSRHDEGIQSAAVEALGLMGPAARSALPVVQEKLKHPHGLVRVHAALALWRIDRKRDGLPVALPGLRSRGYRVRITAAEALWAMKHDPRAISALLEALDESARRHHPNPANARYMAARALGRIGPAARVAAPALRRLLDEEDDYLRRTAADALKAITAKPAIRDKQP